MHTVIFDSRRSILPASFNLAWEGQALVAPAVLGEALQIFNGNRSAEHLGSALAAFPSAFLSLGIVPEEMPDAVAEAQRVLAERLGPRWLEVSSAPARMAFGARPSP